MIKIKIFNPVVGKNRISFQGFLMMKNMLRDYSIEITESDDFDYAFLGADDILNKSMGLKESIEYGLKNIDKYQERMKNTTILLEQCNAVHPPATGQTCSCVSRRPCASISLYQLYQVAIAAKRQLCAYSM